MVSHGIQRLPDAELALMQIIWKAPTALSAKQVGEELRKEGGPGWAHSTIQTLLARLVERDFLLTTKRGRERYYAPLVDRQIYLSQETQGFLSRYYEKSLFGLVSTLAGGRLSEEELSQLREMVKKLEE